MVFSAVTERGSATEKTSDTSHAVSPSAAIIVGKIAWLYASTDNQATTAGATTEHSVTDTDGHTWTKVFERTQTGGSARDGVTHSLWFTKVTSEIGTADSVTLTLANATPAKVLMLWEVTVGAGNSVQLAVIGTSSGFSEASEDTATTSTTGLTSKEYLHVVARGVESDITTWTEDADYTNIFASEGVATSGASAVSNIAGFLGTRIATLTADTAATSIGAARDSAQVLVAIEELAGGDQTITGILLTRTPSFPTGSVSSAITVAGNLLTRTPTFLQGSVNSAITIGGVLLTRTPNFPTGTVSPGGVTIGGSLLTRAPTFPIGSVSLAGGPQTITGILLTRTPSFPTGSVQSAITITGVLLTRSPTFPQGSISSAITISGVLLSRSPTFPVGSLQATATISGILFSRSPSFPQGSVNAINIISGVLLARSPQFPQGSLSLTGPQTIIGILLVRSPQFPTGVVSLAAPPAVLIVSAVVTARSRATVVGRSRVTVRSRRRVSSR